MEKLQLYGTPLSHFTRKLRILLKELALPFDFLRAPGGVLTTDTAAYGDNPLLRVPALTIDGEALIESDHIARYLVGRYDPHDRLGVRSESIRDLNHLAVSNGIMANEVVIILAKRAGLSNTENIAYFQKLLAAIENGLSWLDKHTTLEDEGFNYRDIALICMWQHLVHYGLIQNLERYPQISARVERFAARPSVSSTTPKASLLEAQS